MSIPEWSPVLTKGTFTLAVVLGPFPGQVPGDDKACCAIGVCGLELEDPVDIGFPNLDSLVEYCREMAPYFIVVFNADGSKNPDLREKLNLAADGRLNHILN